MEELGEEAYVAIASGTRKAEGNADEGKALAPGTTPLLAWGAPSQFLQQPTLHWRFSEGKWLKCSELRIHVK